MTTEYEEELKHGVPFLGDAMLKDVFFSAVTVIVVVAIAAMIGPRGRRPARPDPGRCEPAARVAVPLAVRVCSRSARRRPRRSSSWFSRSC